MILLHRSNSDATLAAFHKSQAIIEFSPDSTILTANDNFLRAVGYSLDEIRGQKHVMFVPPDVAGGSEYRQFWDELRAGKFQSAEYRRIGKNGREIWIRASYNPVLDRRGNIVRIVKIATDVTSEALRSADESGQVAAIRKAQAVISFDLKGIVLDANENFLATLGYRLDEIVGQHHGMFVDPAERAKPAYAAFWESLERGEFQAAQYRRIGKGGREVWIQASYNPIFDKAGRPFKVVKFATDITAQSLTSNAVPASSATLPVASAASPKP